MKLLIQTAIIFFGTLLAAAFIALGDPASVVPTFLLGESSPAPAMNVANAAAQPAH